MWPKCGWYRNPKKILEAVRILGAYRGKETRIYLLSHNFWIYGGIAGENKKRSQGFHDESCFFSLRFIPLNPNNGVLKIYGFWINEKLPRKPFGMFFACNGILFNHESATKGRDFRHSKIPWPYSQRGGEKKFWGPPRGLGGGGFVIWRPDWFCIRKFLEKSYRECFFKRRDWGHRQRLM